MEILAFFFLKWIKVILMAFYSVIGSLDLYIRLSFNTSKTRASHEEKDRKHQSS